MDSVTGVGVLDKAVAVMQVVATAPCTLGELQASTGLPRATAHRLATALETHGFLRRDADGRFDLGLGLVSLGEVAAARFPLVELARQVLEQLRDDTGESVQLFVREGDQRRCVLSLESTHGLRWIVPQGALMPLDVGSAGRVLSGETSRTGWIESIGEREPGVASVSAPVVGGGGVVVGALSVSGPIERLTRQPGRRFGAAVAEAAARLSTSGLAG
jgi:DNA-binding IclR family transcriptional regulator